MKLRGEVTVPGDKSITHRAIILAAIAEGEGKIIGWLPSEDCRRTLDAVRAMGVSIQEDRQTLRVKGCGLSGLKELEDVIDCGNSGTTLRLLTGLLSGQPFYSTLTGDGSLRRRPMGRVVDPLRKMGAHLHGRSGSTLAPLTITEKKLSAISYTLPVASAQVKSALLLAGLNAEGTTVITDPYETRDHTERMLEHFGAAFRREGNRCSITGGNQFSGKTIYVPGDFSSAAFLIVAGLIVPDSVITIKNVGINPTRTGLLDILERMGAKIEITDTQTICREPVANIKIVASDLKGADDVGGKIIPRMIDEFPILCIAAACAEGETIIRGAEELRVKESDRIATMARALRAIDVVAEELSDGIRIIGTKRWVGGKCETQGDHRVAMAMKVAQLRTDGEIKLDDETCIDTSFPGFNHFLTQLQY
ncbi:MAG: 3-phosphoshikimate 1-carboxyvinyltransferase, partial [Nitrospirae bacterium]|nr:3-phosphoshikimate 1-carboxyvinyltransferase [Candidatus Troglogloeales bacterium]